jgi:hypothetical protein
MKDNYLAAFLGFGAGAVLGFAYGIIGNTLYHLLPAWIGFPFILAPDWSEPGITKHLLLAWTVFMSGMIGWFIAVLTDNSVEPEEP